MPNLDLFQVEHTLAVAISFGWISKCTNENLGITHIKADFPQWFCFIDYNHLKAIVVEVNLKICPKMRSKILTNSVQFQYFNWVSTFNWNFNDIFIILLSEILTEKFRQINEKIKFGQVVVTTFFFEEILLIFLLYPAGKCNSQSIL